MSKVLKVFWAVFQLRATPGQDSSGSLASWSPLQSSPFARAQQNPVVLFLALASLPSKLCTHSWCLFWEAVVITRYMGSLFSLALLVVQLCMSVCVCSQWNREDDWQVEKGLILPLLL